MRRNRRFPLFSTVTAVVIAAAVGYVSFLDVDVPSRALSKVAESVAHLGTSLRVWSASIAESSIVFEDKSYPAPTTYVPTEDPVPMLVNAANPVSDGYAPSDLVLMRDVCDSNVVTIKGSEIEGDRTAVNALMIMLRAAIDQGVSNWQISAGYRSVKYQQQVWDNKAYEYRQQGLSSSQAQTATAKYVAKPGASEHHTGLAFDVTVPGESFPLTQQCKWLAENCWDYGFIIRYTEDKVAITGINAEQWHIRYVGQPHARIMRNNNWCLEEYIDSLR